MGIESMSSVAGANPTTGGPTGAKKGDGAFAEQLKRTTTKDESSTSETDKEQSAAQSAIDYIKAHGFTAYLEKLRIEKAEELREKLLRAMGLTEEDLANMPMEARAAIEDRIAEEIKRRMAATVESDKDQTAPGDRPANLTSLAASRPGIGNGLALLQVLEQRQGTTEAPGKKSEGVG